MGTSQMSVADKTNVPKFGCRRNGPSGSWIIARFGNNAGSWKVRRGQGPTWGLFLLNRDLPDQRQQRQQQSEQLLPTGQFLSVQENTMLLHWRLPLGLAPKSHPDTPNMTNLGLCRVKIYPTFSTIKKERLAYFPHFVWFYFTIMENKYK